MLDMHAAAADHTHSAPACHRISSVHPQEVQCLLAVSDSLLVVFFQGSHNVSLAGLPHAAQHTLVVVDDGMHVAQAWSWLGSLLRSPASYAAGLDSSSVTSSSSVRLWFALAMMCSVVGCLALFRCPCIGDAGCVGYLLGRLVPACIALLQWRW